jgi:hypothetical protein
MILFPCNNSVCEIREYCLAYYKNCNADESECKKYIPRTVEDRRVVCDNYIHPLRIYGERKMIKINRSENDE